MNARVAGVPQWFRSVNVQAECDGIGSFHVPFSPKD